MSDALRRQLQQRLDSLRMAGVEFLPRVATIETAVPTHASDSEAPSPIVAPPKPPLGGLEPRSVELKLLSQRVALCKRCPELAATRTQTVFGVGPLDPELCFIGEAPGKNEDLKGLPFVGAAGKFLDEMLAMINLKREDIYITNIVKYRPPLFEFGCRGEHAFVADIDPLF